VIRFVRAPRGPLGRVEWGTRRLAVEVLTAAGPRWIVARPGGHRQAAMAPVLRVATAVRLAGWILILFRPHPAGIPYALDALLFWRRRPAARLARLPAPSGGGTVPL
jgi:hypothetical protein